MKLSQICIQRPVFAAVLSLVLILIGVMSYQRLQFRFDPFVYEPHITVKVQYTGASAATVEQTVIQPIEDALAKTANLRMMKSDSEQGWGNVDLSFKAISKEDFLSAQSQVLQELSRVSLPDGASKPFLVMGSNNMPILLVGITDKNKTNIALADYVKNNVLKTLQHVPGVASVGFDAFNPALRITLNPAAMAKLDISVSDLKQTLKDNNVSVPLGQLISNTQVFPVNATLTLPNVQSFRDLVIKRLGNGQLVRLQDIATVAIGPEAAQGFYSQLNGVSAVGLSFTPTDDANPIDVGREVKKTLSLMALQFPPGMKVHTIFDTAHVLSLSVQEVFHTILYSVILVCLVSLLFLGRPKVALIPIVTIPVCLISSFALIWAFGFSINVMTLLALVLATGLVVDDAIVVLENTYRHVESGLDPKAATYQSLKEIGFPVIGMTICLLAVYLPTAFMTGHTAVYFQEFSFTLAGTVLISGFVALTLTPMMCSRLLSQHKHGRLEARVEHFFKRSCDDYQTLLGQLLNHKKWIALVFVLLLGFGVWIFHLLPTALMPRFDMGVLFMLTQSPNSASVDYTHKANLQVIEQIKKDPAVASVWSFSGGVGNSARNGHSIISLKADRHESTAAFGQKADHIIAQNPYVTGGASEISPFGDNRMSGDSSGDFDFYVTGLMSYQQLSRVINNFVTQLNKMPAIESASTDLKFDNQQFDVTINRPLAMELGVPILNITQTLSTLLGGPELGIDFQANTQSYPIILQLPRRDIADFSILKRIYVKSTSGQQYPINTFVSVKPIFSLMERDHINQMRSGDVSVSLAAGATMGTAVSEIQQVAKVTLPAGMQIIFHGKAYRMLENNNSMIWVFVLGIVFIYLVLAALFECFWDPLVILLTVPLSIVGALVVLKLIPGGSLNVYTGVGLVTLIGLISKHGILITSFANDLRERGHGISDAVIQAATIRLRPILMTTCTMILGALPLLFSTGPGSASRFQIGVVIVAGLIIGTFFSLLVVPAAYLLINGIFKNESKPQPAE